MADRKNPFTQIGFAKYEGIHRMPFALKERAITHENNRQRVVASLLLDLYIMAALGILPKGLPLSLRGAGVQNLAGNSENQTQAAHCAPRQLYIGSATPQQYLWKVFPERAWALDVLFAETDILPANFNVCDSRIERYGLNNAFRAACQHAITSGHADTEIEASNIGVKLEASFAIYRGKAALAYRQAVENLTRKLKPKYLFPAEKAKWTNQLLITEQYIETLHDAAGKETGLSRQKIEGLLREYKLNQGSQF